MVINLGSGALRALLAMSSVILVVTSRGSGDTGILWAEARDVAKHPTMHKTAFHNTELSSLKHQQC